ncbi:MAG: hypothetical protein ACI8T1_001035, partial [Verrucomicrobiales bacterium]
LAVNRIIHAEFGYGSPNWALLAPSNLAQILLFQCLATLGQALVS